jgi:hypothetical protein
MFRLSIHTIYLCTRPNTLATISLHTEVCCHIRPINHSDLYSSAPLLFFFAVLTWNMFQPSFHTIYQCTRPSALASISLHAQVCCHITPINHRDLYSSAPFFLVLFFVAPSWIMFQPSIHTIYQCTRPNTLATISLHTDVYCRITPINHSDLYLSAPFFFVLFFLLRPPGMSSNHPFTPSINVQGRALWPASHYMPRFAVTSHPGQGY